MRDDTGAERPNLSDEPVYHRAPDPPLFPPVFYDEDDDDERSPFRRPGRTPRGRRTGKREGGGDGSVGDDGRRFSGPGWGGDGDTVLFRALAVIIGLAVLVAVFVLPPLSLLDRLGGGDDDAPGANEIRATARDDLPELPEGLVAHSSLYDIRAGENLVGPFNLTVQLSQHTTDGSNLAFYTYRDGGWQRLSSVTPTNDGSAAQGEVSEVPENVAVLRRTALASTLALVVGPGEAVDPAAPAAAAVSVLAARPSSVGTIEYDQEALEDARGQDRAVYLGVTAPPGHAAQAVDSILASQELMDTHVEAIVEAVTLMQAAGVHLDYATVEESRRDAFAAFVVALNERLKAEGRGLVVTVPAEAGLDGGYDWATLSGAASALWLRGPDDRSVYYQQVEQVLNAAQEQEIDLSRVSLYVDRSSRERAADGVRRISLRDALTLASEVSTRLDVAIEAGDAVTISGTNLDRDAGNSGLQWDDTARAVTFSYIGRGGSRTVWIENRFSMAFRMDLARRFALGGLVVGGAARDDALPALWEPIATYLGDGTLRLETPYGPYLQPEWTAAAGSIEGGGASGVIVWRAPQQSGLYDLTLVVSDGVVFVGQQIALRVGESGEITSTPEPESDGDASDTPQAEAPPAETTPAVTPPEPTETATETPTETATADPADGAPGTGTPSAPPGPAGNE